MLAVVANQCCENEKLAQYYQPAHTTVKINIYQWQPAISEKQRKGSNESNRAAASEALTIGGARRHRRRRLAQRTAASAAAAARHGGGVNWRRRHRRRRHRRRLHRGGGGASAVSQPNPRRIWHQQSQRLAAAYTYQQTLGLASRRLASAAACGFGGPGVWPIGSYSGGQLRRGGQRHRRRLAGYGWRFVAKSVAGGLISSSAGCGVNRQKSASAQSAVAGGNQSGDGAMAEITLNARPILAKVLQWRWHRRPIVSVVAAKRPAALTVAVARNG